MHILLIHQAYTSLDEAGGTRHHEFAQALRAHGHNVTIIASSVSYLTGDAQRRNNWSETTTTPEGIMVIRTYTYAALHKSFVHRVLSFISFMVSSFMVGLAVKKVDLVWGTSPPIFQGITAWLLARLKNARFLFEVRDLWPAFAIAVGVLKNPLLIRLSNWLERFLYRHADKIIVNSPGFINHVEARGGKHVRLIPNGADPDMFDPDSTGTSFRLEHQLEGKFVVLYAGAHGMSNDLEVVLRAGRLLLPHTNIAIVLLGSGKEKPHLMQLADEWKLTNVKFLPPLPKNKMGEALAGADACIAILKPIELYKTTYPNKVFDYMAAGRPVILAIDGVIREVVENAGAGVFVNPGDPQAMADAIISLAHSPELAPKMGQAGREAITKKYHRKLIAADFIDFIEGMQP